VPVRGQIALELDPVQALQLPVGVDLGEDVDLGLRDPIEDEALAAGIGEPRIDRDPDGRGMLR
jgi:hypothetical protein